MVHYKYYKKDMFFWFGLELPMRRSRSKSAHKTPYNKFNFFLLGVCKILSRSVEIWQYEGRKPVFE